MSVLHPAITLGLSASAVGIALSYVFRNVGVSAAATFGIASTAAVVHYGITRWDVQDGVVTKYDIWNRKMACYVTDGNVTREGTHWVVTVPSATSDIQTVDYLCERAATKQLCGFDWIVYNPVAHLCEYVQEQYNKHCKDPLCVDPCNDGDTKTE